VCVFVVRLCACSREQCDTNSALKEASCVIVMVMVTVMAKVAVISVHRAISKRSTGPPGSGKNISCTIVIVEYNN
jgi:hypothetical protein